MFIGPVGVPARRHGPGAGAAPRGADRPRSGSCCGGPKTPPSPSLSGVFAAAADPARSSTYHRTTLVLPANLGVPARQRGAAHDDDCVSWWNMMAGEQRSGDLERGMVGARAPTAEKLSDALTDTAALPTMAVRMLRLGEKRRVSLPMLASRVAEFYEAKAPAQVSTVSSELPDPRRFVAISIIVGGLIVVGDDRRFCPSARSSDRMVACMRRRFELAGGAGKRGGKAGARRGAASRWSSFWS